MPRPRNDKPLRARTKHQEPLVPEPTPIHEAIHGSYYDHDLDEPIVEDETEIPEDEAGLSVSEADEFRAVLAELAERDGEALKIYEPMPEQERFHASAAPMRIVIGGNRGGKTLATMIEIARAVTGQDPHGKYSKTDVIVILVGKNLRHCGLVLFPLLFKPGAFKVIRDPESNQIRAFRPGNEWDEAHRLEAKEAPPLIPRRFYKDAWISWENKRESIPKSVKLTTGSRILFYSGEAAPPQGMRAHLADFDEEIVHPQWFSEVVARLLDNRVDLADGKFLNGRFIWGATPQSGTQHLYDISEKADAQKEDGRPSIEQFNVSLLGNIHMTDSAKAEFIKTVEDNEDEYNVRVLGHFAIAGSRVYPEFTPKGAHGCESFPVPDSWTRYMFVDPGRQVCAVMLVAVPPPSIDSVTHNGRTIKVKGRKIIYGELYIKKCNATIFATRVKNYTIGTTIHASYIDYRAGRVHEMGSGITIERRYAEALRKAKWKAEKTGHQFIWAADAVKEGIEAFRNGLHIDGEGNTEWLVFHDKCPALLTEVKRYCYKKVPGTNVATDEPLQRDNHMMDNCRYAALARLKYHKPTTKKHVKGSVVAIMAAKREKAKKQGKSDRGGASVKLW